MAGRTHEKRIENELKKAGMTSYGFMKLETVLLPQLIHDEEHIKGVVYGRLHGSLDSVMLVATDRRVLYLDCKPFYKNWDEITYEVVSGVKMSVVAGFAAIVLHTRVQDYELRFVNVQCAKMFTEYIETYIERLQKEIGLSETAIQAKTQKPSRTKPTATTNQDTISTPLSDKSDTLILSTVTSSGDPHASVVHYLTDQEENYYILTKKQTEKFKNISHNKRVALTINDAGSLKVLSIHGEAEEITDKAVFQAVFDHIVHARSYQEGVKLPPITTIDGGDYVALKITPTTINLLDFSTNSW